MFGDKWAPSIVLVQLLSIGLAVEAIMAVTRSALSAAGKFNVSFLYSLANGAGFGAACLVGASIGQTVGLALAVSIYYLTTQPLLFALLIDQKGARLKNLFRITILPALTSSAAFGGAMLVCRAMIAPERHLLQLASISALGWLLLVCFFALADLQTLRELLRLALGLVSRRRAMSKPD
jgi:PST family polysaccharide transporter